MQLICSMLFTKFTFLEPQTTIYKWLFQLDDSQSLHRKWLFHQTSIYKWLFGVPGWSFGSVYWMFLLFFYVFPLRGGARIWQWLGSGGYACGPVTCFGGTALKFGVFFCLPRLSLIDAAVEIRSQLRKEKSAGKILDGKPEQTHACSPFAFCFSPTPSLAKLEAQKSCWFQGGNVFSFSSLKPPVPRFWTRHTTFVSVDCSAAAEHLSRLEAGGVFEYGMVDFETFKAVMVDTLLDVASGWLHFCHFLERRAPRLGSNQNYWLKKNPAIWPQTTQKVSKDHEAPTPSLICFDCFCRSLSMRTCWQAVAWHRRFGTPNWGLEQQDPCENRWKCVREVLHTFFAASNILETILLLKGLRLRL